MRMFSIILTSVFFMSFTPVSVSEDPTEKEIEEAYVSMNQYVIDLYHDIKDESINYKAFEIAVKGYSQLSLKNKIRNKRFLTIVDMSLSSNTERLYIIDLKERKLAKKSLVAHGMKTGSEYAKDFSNTSSSHKSSLGFYLTGELYNGKHDLSMKLDGLEYSNDNARKRGIVVHSAEYVSQDFIKGNGRLGRSFGCPALPEEDYKETVNDIKNGSCFFIYYPDKYYLSKSKVVNANSDILLTHSGKVIEA